MEYEHLPKELLNASIILLQMLPFSIYTIYWNNVKFNFNVDPFFQNVSKLIRDCEIEMEKIRRIEKSMYKKMFQKLDGGEGDQ